jgi:hypothetical protein
MVAAGSPGMIWISEKAKNETMITTITVRAILLRIKAVNFLFFSPVHVELWILFT